MKGDDMSMTIPVTWDDEGDDKKSWGDLIEETKPIVSAPKSWAGVLQTPAKAPAKKLVMIGRSVKKFEYNPENPNIFIYSTFLCKGNHIKARVEKAFVAAGHPEAKVLDIRVKDRSKDHWNGFILMNKKIYAEMLFNGDVQVIVQSPEGEKRLELMDADPVEPTATQFVDRLYLWQLPMTKATDVEESIKALIEPWVEIVKVQVLLDNMRKCRGSAVVFLTCQEDVAKCVQLMNWRNFMGKDIRASFCNLPNKQSGEDKDWTKKKPTGDKSWSPRNEPTKDWTRRKGPGS